MRNVRAALIVLCGMALMWFSLCLIGCVVTGCTPASTPPDPCHIDPSADWIDAQVRWAEAVGDAWDDLDSGERYYNWDKNIQKWKALQAGVPRP